MSNIKLFAAITVTMMILLLSGSCAIQTLQSTPAPKEVQLTQQGGACGSGVGLNQGDTLVLVMDGISSTGYVWEVGYYVPAVIKPSGEQESQSSSDWAGSTENETFRFLAVGEGQAELLMIYKPFDTDLGEPETCQVNVTVGGLET